jgi:prolycopene isomerase
MSTPTTPYDAIVIGSGPGGGSCAALLQKRGIRTLLLEKNDVLGGKMYSVEKDGWAYDIFPHGQVPMRGSAFETLFAELGVSDDFVPSIEPNDPREAFQISYRRRDWKQARTLKQAQGLGDSSGFFGLWGLEQKDQEKVVGCMAQMVALPEEKLDELDDVTMHEYLQRFDIPYELYSYMAFHANASLAEPVDLVAASEQIRILKDILIRGGGGQYKGGFGLLTKVIMREFERHGGTILRNHRVERILVENGAVTGVVTPKGTFRAPVVVSSAGLQPTVLKLVGREHFDASYVSYIESLIPGWGFTSIRYFLNRPVMDVGIYTYYSDDSWWNMERFLRMKEGRVPDEVSLFMVNHSFFDDEAAPPGKQILVAGTVCSGNPEAKEMNAIWAKMDEQMQRFYPQIWAAVERKEYSGPKEIRDFSRDSVLPGQGGECVGLGQIVGQCGKKKPSVISPVRGLYYAGADAGAAGMGTHQASLSGMEVARLVQLERLKRSKAQ